MHCPTCGKTYAEGSQRFCDADGSRLISISDDEYRRGKQSVFSTILPIATAADAEPSPYGFGDHSTASMPIAEVQTLYFVDDSEEDIRFVPNERGEFEIADEPDNRVFGRRVDPGDIPAGHIEVGEYDHPSLNTLDFDADEPEGFIGRVVKGRYRVTEFIGEDETGFAYIADDRIVEDRRVVVRLLTGEDLDDVTKSIFAEERVSLSHLTHPNVVRLIDSGEFVDGTPFLISEHIEALNLADILQIHGPLTPERTARLMRQAGNALSDVHNEGILHRDLRPELLLISHTDGGTDQVRISNFGVYDGEPTDENIAYKAPEILDGRIPTLASDIYALGVIAYQTLAGVIPFNGSSVRDILRAQRAGLATMPTDIRPELPQAVDHIFVRALSADPLERFPTAREFGDALYAALTSPAAEDRSAVEPAANSTELSAPVAAAQDIKLPRLSMPRTAKPIVEPTEAQKLAWQRRSPDPVSDGSSSPVRLAIAGLIILAIIAAGVWYYVLRRQAIPEPAPPARAVAAATDSKTSGDVPPAQRSIQQPPNSAAFRNDRTALKGDLYRNFAAFSLYYPAEGWKLAGPEPSVDGRTRGKFLDLARSTTDGKLMEQMLVSYYPSVGTFAEDSAKFPQLVAETNETLKKIIPNYQMVSEGETKLNGGWRAYEVRFQASGTDANGERMNLWGRRIFVPPARPGIRSGFEITLLATSNSPDVRSVDDVGTRGELARILETFEPETSF